MTGANGALIDQAELPGGKRGDSDSNGSKSSKSSCSDEEEMKAVDEGTFTSDQKIVKKKRSDSEDKENMT